MCLHSDIKSIFFYFPTVADLNYSNRELLVQLDQQDLQGPVVKRYKSTIFTKPFQ